jgi:tetratricopeptide (TPR) repeat protein
LLNDDLETAQNRFERALEKRAPTFRAETLACLGHVAKERGDHDEARRLYADVLQWYERNADATRAPLATITLVEIAMNDVRDGRLDDAKIAIDGAVERARAGDSVRALADALRGAGAVAIARGELDAAEAFLAEGLRVFRSIPEKPRIERFFRRFAELRVAQGRWADAARALGVAEALRDAMGAVVQPIVRARYDTTVDATRARLTPDAFVAAWSAGRAATLDDAMAELLGERGAAPVEVAQPLGSNVFRSEGDVWLVEFDGQVARVKDSRGMQYLRHLLRNPGQEIHVLELAALLAGGTQTTAEAPVELLDEQARRAYRERLADLEETVREANEWGDDERAARAQEEMDALLAELSRAVGLGGRARTGSAAERARSTITKAVKAALTRVKGAHAALGRHLETTVKTGLFCSYTPDPRVPARWDT